MIAIGIAVLGSSLTRSRVFCGGALIYENIVVTSAKCIEFVTDPSGKVEVFAGLNLKNDQHSQKKLDGKFTINEYVKTINIAKLTDIDMGRRLRASDCGQYNKGSDVLVSIELPTVRKEVCQDKNGFVRDGMVYASHIIANEDGCGGDAASPVVLGNELIAVYIYSKKCEKAEAPQVVTDVSYHKDWIKHKAEEINEDSAPSHGAQWDETGKAFSPSYSPKKFHCGSCSTYRFVSNLVRFAMGLIKN